MNGQKQRRSPLVLSYLELRMIVGFVGLALPFVLSVGGVFAGVRFPDSSLSIYYHSPLRNQFVASLCVIAVFLIACKGFDKSDRIAGYIAGASAIGVAFFPTADHSMPEDAIGKLHYGFAAVLFLTLSYFCLFLFRQSNDPNGPTRRKRMRNKVYLVSGVLILASISGIGLSAILKRDFFPNQTFWLESTAVVAFGAAWLIKGEVILKDQHPRPASGTAEVFGTGETSQ